MIILAGDIGGTKTVLAIYEHHPQIPLKQLKQCIYACADFPTFEAILTEFLSDTQAVDCACFGIAGPILNQRCQTTNLPWVIDALELSKTFNIPRIQLLNDLEAMSFGMLTVGSDQLIELNPNARQQSGNKAVIAAGTGLGQAILNHNGNSYLTIATEGGHCDFAPLNEQQDALLHYLRKQFPEHVSYERILSGDGFSVIYDFLLTQKQAVANDVVPGIEEAKQNGIDRNAIISELGINEKDDICKQTVNLFTQIYGAEAGNLVLKSFAIGGLFIGGGIAPKILPALKQGDFLAAFLRKGRFRNLLNEIPVQVCTEPKTPLIGAAHFFIDL